MKARQLPSVCLLLLVYLAARLHNLSALPLFVDESFHIETAQRFWDGQYLTSASHGRLLRVWYNALLGPYPPATGWVTRAGTIIVCLLGITAFYALIRAFVSHRAGLLGMVLWIVTPYLVFYDRMALADPLLGALSAVAVLFAWRLVQKPSWLYALYLSVSIALVILAKASGVVWLPLPAVALLFMRDVPWKKRIALAVLIYGGLAVFWGPLLLIIRSRGYNYFGLASGFVGGVDQSITSRTWHNLKVIWEIDWAYLSFPIMLLAVLGGLYWLWRKPRPALFALAVLGMGAGGTIAFGHNVNSRYGLNQVIWVLLPLVVGASLLIERKRYLQWAVYAALAVWCLVFALPFQWDAWNHPRKLDLHGNDRPEYISGEASGYGVQEAGQMLHRLDDGLPTLGFVANCQTLRIAAHPHDVTCPVIHWDASNQEMMVQAQQWAANGPIYAVGENVSYIDLSALPQPNTLIATFERPGGGVPVLLYRIEQGAVIP